MKKTVVVTLIVVLSVTLLIGMPIFWKMERVRYESELLTHFAAAISDGELIAEHDGIKTRLSTDNIERLRVCLIRSERQILLFHTRENTGELVSLYVDDEMQIELEQPDPDEDIVYIYYTNGLVKRTYSIEKYDTMNWALQLIAPDGLYGENEEIA